MRWTTIPMPKEVIDRVEQMVHQEHAGTTLLFEDHDHNEITDLDQEDDDDDSDYDPNNDNDDDDDDDDDNNNAPTNQPTEPYEDQALSRRSMRSNIITKKITTKMTETAKTMETTMKMTKTMETTMKMTIMITTMTVMKMTPYMMRMSMFIQPMTMTLCLKTEAMRKRKKSWTITLVESQEWNRNRYHQYKSKTNKPNAN